MYKGPSVRSVSFLVGWLKCYFTSTETVGLLGTGAQDVHLDFHTAPEFCEYFLSFYFAFI